MEEIKMNYRQWQKRNTETFQVQTQQQQKQLRSEGYNNRGWVNVKQSWDLLVKVLKDSQRSGALTKLEQKRIANEALAEFRTATKGMSPADSALYAANMLRTRREALAERFTR